MMLQKEQHAAAVKERALAIFDKLLLLPEFMRWMQDNIVIRDEVDEEKKTITTYVIYKPSMSMADKAKLRPSNFDELPAEEQREIDKTLGILDWDGKSDTTEVATSIPEDATGDQPKETEG